MKFIRLILIGFGLVSLGLFIYLFSSNIFNDDDIKLQIFKSHLKQVHGVEISIVNSPVIPEQVFSEIDADKWNSFIDSIESIKINKNNKHAYYFAVEYVYNTQTCRLPLYKTDEYFFVFEGRQYTFNKSKFNILFGTNLK